MQLFQRLAACARPLAPAVLVLFATPTPTGAAPPSPESATVVRDEEGRFWFHHPDLGRFFSLGINTVQGGAWNPRADTRYYDAVARVFGGDRAAWNRSVVSILSDQGFNTLGAWSDPDAAGNDPRFLRTPVLYVAAHTHDRMLAGLRPGFDKFARDNASEILAKYPDRSRLLGLFLDNEAAWFGKNGWSRVPNDTLLELALDQPATDPARAAAIRLLSERYPSPAALATAWELAELPAGTTWDSIRGDTLRASINTRAEADRDAFIDLAARAFFDIAAREVRLLAPGVLLLGVRFAGEAPDPVIRACGSACEVISLNHYSHRGMPDPALLSRFWLEGRRPIMITEFSYRGAENLSGNPNTGGAGRVVPTQAVRARMYASMVGELIERPEIIAAHWFEWADQSPQGRFDGENSNYGVVSINHQPYTDLLAAMKQTNLAATERRRASTRTVPTAVEQHRVRVNSGSKPAALPVSIHRGWTTDPLVWGASDSRMAWRLGPDHLVLEYDTGMSWGAGVSLAGPASARVAPDSHVSSYAGASAVVLDADVPAGLLINLTLDEAPAPRADAEVYLSPPRPGEAGRREYRFPFDAFKPNLFAGSQDGSLEIDLGAVARIGLQVQGVPRTGVVRVYGLRVE